MDFHQRPLFFLAIHIGLLLLGVGEAEHGERQTIQARGGFYDMRQVITLEQFLAKGDGGGARLDFGFSLGGVVSHPFLDDGIRERLLLGIAERGGGGAEFVVKDFERFPRMDLMLREVEISPGGDAFEFLGSEGEFEKNIHAGPGIVGEVRTRLPVVIQHVRAQPDGGVKFRPLIHPVTMPHLPAPVRLRCGEVRAFRPDGDAPMDKPDGLIRCDEKFQLHLLELP